ncbi:MAG: translation initiation factor IF-3 [Planctomycetaceae bacterium]|jgi:translation initiation factor IF-3|nr:translation initiation factor IF-3 [Planctomycetaceae bacterium]
MTQRRTEGSSGGGIRNNNIGGGKNQHRINEMIRISPVRVVSATGEQLGVISTVEAISTARTAGLDLVEVAPDSRPPVCRIMDYGKFKYQQKKRGNKQQTHQTKIKQLRLRPKTGDHDVQVRLKQARDFLVHKDKVQVFVMFKGRELAHIEEGQKLMEYLIEQLEDVAKIEAPPKRMEKRVICTLAPK